MEEDESSGPQTNSRQLLARFNEQMEELYKMLRMVENIRLAPVVLEPEPVEFNKDKGSSGQSGAKAPADGIGALMKLARKCSINTYSNILGNWSGEASRAGGFRMENQEININFGESTANETKETKAMPDWISQSTVTRDGEYSSATAAAGSSSGFNPMIDDSSNSNLGPPGISEEQSDEITSILLRHEKKEGSGSGAGGSGGPVIPGFSGNNSDNSEKSDDSDMEDVGTKMENALGGSNDICLRLKGFCLSAVFVQGWGASKETEEVGEMSDDDDEIPTVKINGEDVAVTDVTPEQIEKMTTEEKERYTQIFQDFYSHMYE